MDERLAAEENIHKFQILRNEQRQIATKVSEHELEDNELSIVVSTLNDVDGDRRCYRLIGGVLYEKTVKDILPILQSRSEQVKMKIETLKELLTNKGVEINEFKEKHGIKLRGVDEMRNLANNADSSASRNVVLNRD